MLKRLKSLLLGRVDAMAGRLYRAVVAQSRLPLFYRDYAMPDTPAGRLELLHLHLLLVSRRLSAEGTQAAAGLSQDLFDCHVEALDDALREIGIGDTSVPRRKKRMVRGFYAQIAELGPPLAAADASALAAALSARRPPGADALACDRLAAYLVAAEGELARLAFADIAANRLRWPDPGAVR